jgi:hypothetical protein
MHTFNLDISNEKDQDFAALRDYFAGYGLDLVDWIEHGPGGGNPNVTLHGTLENFQKWNEKEYGSDDPKMFIVS